MGVPTESLTKLITVFVQCVEKVLIVLAIACLETNFLMRPIVIL